MSLLAKQGVLAVVFFSCIGYVAWQGAETKVEPVARDVALERHGFYLDEASQQAGLDFKHENPTFDKKLDHIMPIIASMGAGASIVDFDRDGLLDIYVVNGAHGSKNKLFKNMGGGTFKDVAEAMGVADLNTPETGVCQGAVWGDFDNDGYEDLLVYKWGKPELFHNDRGQGFTRVTDKAGLPKWLNCSSAIWLDYDCDGKLDLFLAGYWPDNLDLSNLETTQIMPKSFEYAENGGRKYLLRNKGDGTFEDVTAKMGINSTRWSLAVAAADLCGTGYPDIVLANDYGVSEFYANQKGKVFKEVGEKCGIGVTPKSGMNVSFGDIFNEGRLAIYISNISEPGNLVQGNNLWWVSSNKQTGIHPEYKNLASTLRVNLGGWSWGAQFGDLNNDGWQDLYLTNGYISANRHKSYWLDYSLIAGAAFGNIIQDAKNWPPIKDQSLSGYQQKCLWTNRRGQFVDVAPQVGVTDTSDGRAVALADLSNRGVLDVVVANQNGRLLLYRNTVPGDNGWVQFDLEGTTSNRSAIGAQVTLHWSQKTKDGHRDLVQLQAITGGCGYAAQNMRRLHFGLGKEATIHKAVIKWPSGMTQTVTAPQAGVCHKIKEPMP